MPRENVQKKQAFEMMPEHGKKIGRARGLRCHLTNLVFIIFLFASMINGKEAIPLPDLMRPGQIYVQNNRVYIVDGIEIRMYSAKDYRFQKMFGREGEGPKEFKSEVSKLFFTDKYFMVNSAGRVSYFTLAGEYIKEKNSKHPRAGNYLPAVNSYVGLQVVGENNRLYKVVSIFDSDFNRVKELCRIEDDFRPGKEYRTFIEPQLYEVCDDKIYVTFSKEFLVTVYSSAGETLFTVNREYERVKVTEEHKKAVDFFFRTDEYYKKYYNRIKPLLTFPAYLPAIRYIFCSPGKLYVQTYRTVDGKAELFIFDLSGKFLKKTSISFIEGEFSYNDMLLPPLHTIYKDKLYQLLENEDEEWELHVTTVK